SDGFSIAIYFSHYSPRIEFEVHTAGCSEQLPGRMAGKLTSCLEVASSTRPGDISLMWLFFYP
ncbi:MAG: hypothetical protein V3U62_03620, partial [Sedimenticolaceae bacterium]